MKKFIVVPVALVALAASACGTMQKQTDTATVTQTQTQPAASAPAAKPKPKPKPASDSSTNLSGPVGTAFTDTDDSNNKMAVKLTHVMDPAQGADEFNTPDNGNRFVGAKFKITGLSGTFSDDANSDAVLVGSNGQSYQPDFSDIRGCTNFNAGSYSVSPGTSSVGCVVFQVPENVQASSIQWGSEFGGTPATWTL